MHVEVFSDVVCPWCYIGKRRFDDALTAFAHRDSVQVTYRSFQLDPSTPVDVTGSQAERLAEKYRISLDQAEAMNARVAGVAAEAGIDVDLGAARPANTFDAHRLLHFAADHGHQAAMNERLLAAHFARGEHVGDAATLVRLAGEVGLDPEAADAVIHSDDYADAVREDLSLARSLGISSVPFFVIDRKYGLAGAQEAAVLQQALEHAWAETHPLTVVGAAPTTDGDSGCVDGACAV